MTEDNFKWILNRERVYIELYDQLIFITNYRFKDHTPTSRKFRGDKFNQEFNISVTYRFSKEKLNQPE
ncbi:hypothetical protein HID58_051894 [Brassica napus]|uniref:Uncharacterized protein n=1 Tax=Brassica napus TaxID=3708 RepID=A0ABQ8ABN8_BRANA|nr:hypothetical protein HID58_051894 [Brassica napus]